MGHRWVTNVLVWLLAAVACHAYAQVHAAVPTAAARAVQAVVAAQLDAFAKGDAVRAFSYASPDIRKAFSTPGRFMAMARHGYPVLFEPANVTFFKPVQMGDEVLQRVQLADAQGDLWVAFYTLKRQPDKAWRITGCTLAMSEGLQTFHPSGGLVAPVSG